MAEADYALLHTEQAAMGDFGGRRDDLRDAAKSGVIQGIQIEVTIYQEMSHIGAGGESLPSRHPRRHRQPLLPQER
jgi:hypothetical protein